MEEIKKLGKKMEKTGKKKNLNRDIKDIIK